MPAIIKSSSTFPAIDRPPSTQRSSPAPSSFHVYDAGDDEVPRTSTPDPIKVTRPKKKGATGAKKKRTPKVENIS
jgi:AP-3 complex subunit delta-1